MTYACRTGTFAFSRAWKFIFPTKFEQNRKKIYSKTLQWRFSYPFSSSRRVLWSLWLVSVTFVSMAWLLRTMWLTRMEQHVTMSPTCTFYHDKEQTTCPLLVLSLIISSFVALSFLEASTKIQPALTSLASLTRSKKSVALAHREAVVPFAPMVSTFWMLLLILVARVSPVTNFLFRK
jgi:hypothetical protein